MKSQIYETLDELLSDLNNREADIVKKRFGIGFQASPLEKIGKEYGITRERVRQIEEKALKKLALKSLQIPFLGQIFHPIVDDLLGSLKIKREIFIYRKLSENYGLEETEKNILRLYFYIFEKIFYKKEDKLVNSFLSTEKDFFEKGFKILNHLHTRLLKNKGTLLKEEELLEMIAKEISYHFKLRPSIEEILEFLKISKIIKRNPLNEYGYFKHFKISPASLREKIKIIFEIEKQPLHFNEIYQKLFKIVEIEDELLSPLWRKKYNNHSIHNVLLSDSNFVKYGRGKYVLKEWGYEEGHIIDLMKKILEKKGEMDLNELYEFVKKHKEVSPNTFRLYLYKFFRIKNHKVSLKND